MIADWLTLTKMDLMKAIRKSSLDGLIKAAICGTLASVDDATFNYYRQLLARIVWALAETENGRAILAEFDIDPASVSASQN